MSLLRVPVHSLRHAFQRRTLVSTVLLTKQWNDLTVADLRKEAKSRGLPANGGKASLITRIQQHETQTTLAAIAPEPVSVSGPSAAQQVRHAHVSNPPTATPAAAQPADPATAPGVPPADTPKYDKQYLDVKIPSLSIADAETPVQIPFSPDFWHSKTPASGDPQPATAPKLLVVEGSARPGTTATAVHDAVEASTASAASAVKSAEHVVEDAAHKVADYTRALNDEERRGAWTLGGILVGSFLLAGFFDTGSAVEKASLKAKELKHKADAEAAHVKAKAEELGDTAKGKVNAAKAKAGELTAAASKKVDEAKGTVSAKAEEVKKKVVGH